MSPKIFKHYPILIVTNIKYAKKTINDTIDENIEKKVKLNLIFCQMDSSSKPSVCLIPL